MYSKLNADDCFGIIKEIPFSAQKEIRDTRQTKI